MSAYVQVRGELLELSIFLAIVSSMDRTQTIVANAFIPLSHLSGPSKYFYPPCAISLVPCLLTLFHRKQITHLGVSVWSPQPLFPPDVALASLSWVQLPNVVSFHFLALPFLASGTLHSKFSSPYQI